MQVQSLGREDTLEERLAPHSSTVAWSIGLQKVGHNRSNSEHTHTLTHTKNSWLQYMGSSSLTRNWTPVPCIGSMDHWTTREVSMYTFTTLSFFPPYNPICLTQAVSISTTPIHVPTTTPSPSSFSFHWAQRQTGDITRASRVGSEPVLPCNVVNPVSSNWYEFPLFWNAPESLFD